MSSMGNKVCRGAVALFVVAVAFTALAGGVLASPASGTVAEQVRGIEIWPGMPQGGEMHGATFIGIVEESHPGVIFASINYKPPRHGPNSKNHITGGQWGIFGNWGSIKGRFAGGHVNWRKSGKISHIKTTFDAGKSGSGFHGGFEGKLNEFYMPPRINGELTLVIGKSGQR